MQQQDSSAKQPIKKTPPTAGIPISPILTTSLSLSTTETITDNSPILIRYIYDGGIPSQGRLCHLFPTSSVITVSQVISTLIQDGVDLNTFYACAYESLASSGGWMPLERGPRTNNPFDGGGGWKDEREDSGLVFPLDVEVASVNVTYENNVFVARRIDVKLYKRPMPHESNTDNDGNPFLTAATQQNAEYPLAALQAIQSSIPSGQPHPIQGYFGLAILQPKTHHNIGTLLRSSYQLGASILYTVGGRYKPQSGDTLCVPQRIPLLEVPDWNAFVESAPRGAVWVVIEMGGTPLSQYVHPKNAIYILGSEDNGVPKNVLRACRDRVALEAVGYGSYNVGVAGSIVMYDRMVKMRKEKEGEGGSGGNDGR